MLVGVLDLLESCRVSREAGVNALTRLATEWPWGAIETLEFCLRRLQWTELEAVLVEQARGAGDFRQRDMAKSVLEVYHAEWPGGDIYRTYRV